MDLAGQMEGPGILQAKGIVDGRDSMANHSIRTVMACKPLGKHHICTIHVLITMAY